MSSESGSQTPNSRCAKYKMYPFVATGTNQQMLSTAIRCFRLYGRLLCIAILVALNRSILIIKSVKSDDVLEISKTKSEILQKISPKIPSKENVCFSSIRGILSITFKQMKRVSDTAMLMIKWCRFFLTAVYLTATTMMNMLLTKPEKLIRASEITFIFSTMLLVSLYCLESFILKVCFGFRCNSAFGCNIATSVRLFQERTTMIIHIIFFFRQCFRAKSRTYVLRNGDLQSLLFSQNRHLKNYYPNAGADPDRWLDSPF